MQLVCAARVSGGLAILLDVGGGGLYRRTQKIKKKNFRSTFPTSHMMPVLYYNGDLLEDVANYLSLQVGL